jgi:selenocysteine-specific translation elongation factor
MGNLTVAVLGSLSYGGNLGKKGTSTDITFYNLKKGEDTITFIEPTRYPERLAPLFYAVSLSTKAIIVIEELNATVGEQLVMLQCSSIQDGYIVLRNYIPKEKILPLIKGTSLEKFEIINDDPIQIREHLLAEAATLKPPELSEGQQAVGAVPVDHAFNVKGVGVVVLGVVVYGFVAKHANLNVLPAAKTAQVRSIQKHDEEYDLAGEGDRVGLALKNVDVEDLDRGAVLTNDSTVKTATQLNVAGTLMKYWQTPIKQGMVMHVGHWTQFITAKVEAVSDNGDYHKPTLTLSLDKPLVYRQNDQATLMYLEGAKLRVAGSIKLE